MTDYPHTVVLMAMRDEAHAIIEAMQLKPVTLQGASSLPMELYQGQFKGAMLSLLLSGRDPRYDVDYIGTQAATLSAYVAIRDLHADRLISAGTAGGFAHRGAQIGTVYLSDQSFVFHDRCVPLPGFDESAVGRFPSANVRGMARALDLPYGVVSSGSSLEKSERDVAVIKTYQAVAKEMEAAAIAWVAWMHKVPFFALKSITNLLDKEGTSEDQFSENLRYSSNRLCDEFERVIAYSYDKTTSALAGD